MANQKLKIKMQNYSSKFKNKLGQMAAEICEEAVMCPPIIGRTCAFWLKFWGASAAEEPVSICEQTSKNFFQNWDFCQRGGADLVDFERCFG